MKKLQLQTSWLTIVELVVAVAISTLILWGIFYFLADVLDELGRNNSRANYMSSFQDFSQIIHQWQLDTIITGGYTAGIIHLDHSDEWLIIWVVNEVTWRLTPIADYNIYLPNLFWIRKISWDEMSLISENNNYIYQIDFYNDELFKDFFVSDFNIYTYNAWEISQLVFEIFRYFNDSLEWEPKINVPMKDIEQYSIFF